MKFIPLFQPFSRTGGLLNRPIPNSDDDPDGADVLGVEDHFDPQSVPHLVAATHQNDILANLILEDVMNHSLRIEVSKLNGEGLESVALRHVVLYR